MKYKVKEIKKEMTNPKLALIPSGYKATKVYSILPSDGGGDFTFDRTSEGTRVRKDGLIEEVSNDVPRLDWSDGSCPSLLLEAERTNDTTYSEDYTQTSYWGNVIDVVATKDEAVAPDGNFTANKIQANSGTNFKILRTNAFTIPSGVTMSMFVKKGNHDYIIFKAQGDYEFNLSTLQFNQSYSNVGYEDYGNGWIRLYATTNSSVLSYFGIYLTDSNFNQSWTATGNEFVYVWGGQYETGDYPTSYIKTEASTVTRLKDECENGGDSDLFDFDECSIYLDLTPFVAGFDRDISLSAGNNNDRFTFFFRSNGTQLLFGVWAGSSNQLYRDETITYNTRNKLLLTAKENEFKIYINGTLKFTDTFGVFPTGINKFSFATPYNSNHFEGKVHDTRVYDRVLTEAEAIELTTL
jgi:hypothetical protein